MAPKKQNLSPREKAKKKRKTITIFILEVLILAILVMVALTLNKATKVQKIVINEEEVGIDSNIAENEEMEKFTNIALFGIDARDGSLDAGQRSDTIIIASINEETKDVKLVSVYRDTYLNMLDGSYNKVNAAYAYGGPENAITVLNSNLNMNIKDFVAVGFRGVVDTVDSLGGIWIDVDSAEFQHLNNYVKCIAEDLDMTPSYIDGTGYQLLNGLQATAYCRIRYTAGNDFKRTERQREVIQAILEEVKTADTSTVLAIADDIFPYVSTTLSLDEIVDVLSAISQYNIVETSGFPFASNITTATVGSKSVVIPMDLKDNVLLLHEFLFGETNFELSDKVLQYNQEIIDETSPYIVQ